MSKQLENIVAYPVAEQGSSFFCALSSAMLPALGVTEGTPYFCGPKNRNCTPDSMCGKPCDVSQLKKHHLALYHHYQTFSSVSLGWAWPEEDDSPYQVIPGWEKGWRWPDEFLGFLFGRAGLAWKRLRKGADRDMIVKEVVASIDAGIPALIRLGMDWHTIIGYGDAGVFTALSYKAKEPAPLAGWYDAFEDAIIITGHAERTVTHTAVLTRMADTLAHPNHVVAERDIMTRLDAVTPENALETAEYLLKMASFPIEQRWHAAEYTNAFADAGKAVNDKLFGMLRQYVFDDEVSSTHGTCWKIWGQLGVGPKTKYRLPDNAAELLLKPETQAELKHLFAIVFENDRIVLGLLREAVDLSK